MKGAKVFALVCCLLMCGGFKVIDEPRTVTYSPSADCRGCHVNIYQQHLESEHEKSFTNPVFQAQYFGEFLPLVGRDASLIEEAKGCIACHSPITYLKTRSHVTSREQVDPSMSGVTCDFCHSVKGYLGDKPQNGNFIAEPGEVKFGPFKRASNWHHVYAELQTKSEICAVCHNAVNRNGVEVKATYTEWKKSRYAEQGIECQDCHMTLRGFLTAGKPEYEEGAAAYMTLGSAPVREKLYTHRFPGAHSRTQVSGALRLQIEPAADVSSGSSEMPINVLVDNERTGHKMPSGSADLRLLWLQVEAFVGGRAIPLAATAGKDGYDVAGMGASDKEILGDDVPRGSRIYRAIYLDGQGRQTLACYTAASIVFDNRLNAGEVRKETFRLPLPRDSKGAVTIRARLYYQSYPSYFTSSLGQPKAPPVEVAVASKEIALVRSEK